MEWPARRYFLVFLSLLTLWSIAVDVASPAAAATPAPVRVGVVLDLTSDVGKKTRACISKALRDFDAAQRDSYSAVKVELRVIDSRGDLAVAAHAARDLIKIDQFQGIIWGPTPSGADQAVHLGHSNHVPVLSFPDISPTLCAFWLENPITASEGHAKFGFTLGSDMITFHTPKNDRRIGIELDTRKTSEDCEGSHMKIAVPLNYGFKEFVHATDPNSTKNNFTGYSIDIFEAAMQSLHPSPCYDFFLFQGTYDELVGNVSIGVYDGAVGDVTITTKRVALTDFTVPYTQSGVSMLVLTKDESDDWIFVKPLTWQLWVATIVFFIYTAFVVWMIELPRNQEYQGSWLRQFSTALYFSFSTLTFSHGQSIRSPLSKIAVVIWCFVVLILVQSYTASLSSMLTAKRLLPWVTDLDQLQRNSDFVGYQDDSFVQSFLINHHNFSESKLVNYTTKEEYADALRKGSKKGGVSAIVDEIPYLTSFLSDPMNKNDFMMLGCIYKTPGFGFAFRLGSPLVHNLSTAILNLSEGTDGSLIEAKWFGTTSPLMGAGMVPDTDSPALTLRSFSGLFIITGSISTLVLLITIVRLVQAKCTAPINADIESGIYSNVDEASPPLQDGVRDNPSVHQGSLHEASSNDAEDVHVADENAEDGEPGPVQLNDMHTRSGPPTHVQIEMSNV